MLINSIGLYLAVWWIGCKKRIVSIEQLKYVMILAVLKVSVSIFSHYSTLWLSVAYAETVRTLMPLMVVFVSMVVYHTKFTISIYVSVCLISFGVTMATLTEYDLAIDGLKVSLLMVVASNLLNFALKYFMENFDLHPFALYLNMHLIGIVLVTPIWLFYDFQGLRNSVALRQKSNEFTFLFIIQGLFSCGSHISKATFISSVSAVTYSVVVASKSIFKIILGFVQYRHPTTPLNVIGTSISVLGVLLYSSNKSDSKNKKD